MYKNTNGSMSKALQKPGASSSCTTSLCRSAELLSCARTAVKIGGPALAHVSVDDLRLATTDDDHNHHSPQHTHSASDDAMTLLRSMQLEMKQLEGLVRRRGQTNDPTAAIAESTARWEQQADELQQLLQTGFVPVSSYSHSYKQQQAKKHWQLVQQWFSQRAQYQAEQWKAILKIRGTVLADQQRQRQKFQYQATTSSSRSTPTASYRQPQANNPLFQNNRRRQQQQQSHPKKNPYPQYSAMSSSSSYNSQYTGYGGSSSHGAAGASNYYQPSGSGMRQRRSAAAADQQGTTAAAAQQQLQLQRQNRQRLQEAQQAEQNLAQLGTLFGKFSTLVTQQAETLERIEDDVEAAALDVGRGQTEIANLQAIKKGNRALILKVFGLLIFLIIFLRLYRGK